MNELSTEKTMTVKEVAEALGCSDRTVRRHALELGLTKNGIETYITQSQATVIKTMIERSGRNDLDNVVQLPNIKTDVEMGLRAAEAALYFRQRNEYLEKELLEARPKIEFYNAVTDSSDAIDIGTAAKVLNLDYGRNILFEILRDKKILMENNQPYQKYIDAGYFRVIEQKYMKNGEVHISFKTVVYQKGLDYIREIMKCE